ncbi:extracellular solute-binding protein [Herbidospora mongoliensis]|uniref:extracellular solute-binding protein n=1 Tax=Herbidospora mongoliensis TaxID=688067 RepID=UPI0008315C51|nr:extracellular solute-binding protein [Herbidospora mongoliensis]
MIRRPRAATVRLLAGALVGALVGWLVFGPAWQPAGTSGCAAAGGTLTVAAGWDESIDQQRARIIKAWSDNGFRAAFTQISPVTDDKRVEMAASVGDCPFDILILDVAHLAEFAASGAIAEVTLPPGRSFLPRTVEAGVYQGRQYGVPFAADVPLLYSRGDTADLVRRAWSREPVPESRAEGTVIVQLDDYEGASVNLMEAIGLGNLANFGEEVPGAAALRRAFQPGLSRWARLYRDDTPGMRRSAGYKERDSVEEFRLSKGPVVMRNWPSSFGALAAGDRFRTKDRRLSFTIEPVPGGVLGGSVLAISSGLDDARAAAARVLVDHLTAPQTQAELFTCGSYAPVLSESYDLDTYAGLGFTTADACLNLGDSPDATSYRAEFGVLATTVRDAIGEAGLRPPIPHYSRFSEVFRRCARAIVTGAVTDVGDDYYGTFSAALSRAATGRLTEGAASSVCR